MINRILIHNAKTTNNNFHLLHSLWQAFKETSLQIQISQPQTLQLFIKNFQPELIICFGGEQISPAIKHLKSSNAKWILWTTEDPFEINFNKQIAKHFDIVLTSDKASQNLYSHPHCYYLPLAASKNWFYHPVIKQPSKLLYDLIFIGTAWPNRTNFLKELLSLLKQNYFTSRFILPTNPHIPQDTLSDIDIIKFERDFRLAPTDLADLQNHSLFALTLFRDFSGDGNPRPQSSPTNRFYETALAGTGQIIVSNDINIPEFYPEIKDHIFQLQNAHEIIDTITYVKQNPEIRNYAASSVQQFVIDNHSYSHRVKELLKIIGSLNN
ncbi:MAG: glycosyltransferase [Calothrix sp. FI2-JRJ7]|jgi:spore maturation protein CgeB|nr:glycosyltransferase [Calothrix sp. FI2-JRJ7]